MFLAVGKEFKRLKAGGKAKFPYLLNGKASWYLNFLVGEGYLIPLFQILGQSRHESLLAHQIAESIHI